MTSDLAEWLPRQLDGDWDPISQAHRAILARHHARTVMVCDYEYYEPEAKVCAECTPEGDGFDLTDRFVRFPCPTWFDLALAYQHNDGYRPEWCPPPTPEATE